ncbi:MAG: DMT family transporter [Cyanobacteria bacterium P01_A01_bin.135]
MASKRQQGSDEATAVNRWHVFVILGLGVLCVSTSAVFIRLALAASETQGLGFSLVVAAVRLTLASLLLLPVTLRAGRRPPCSRGTLLRSAVAGGLLAIHFAAWITSLSYTSITASTTLVTTNPVWVALIAWVWLGDRPSRSVILGIVVTLIGGAVIGWDQGTVGQAPLLGNSLALVGAWTFSLYFLLGQQVQQRGLSVGQHSAIAYTTAALVLLPLPLLVGVTYSGYPASVYGWIAMMALVPQLLGHTSLNWAVRHVSPTLVTLVILLEPVGASLLGYLAFGEVPGLRVVLGAGVVLAGVAIATEFHKKSTGEYR